ncbi:hypothetical protein ACIBL6_26210 [Streptomyces sp. NPDC050400]|uniref:hypothetical protein n=1 Tax=Streptomyces sp. NPDC050400 TaxID=3365610 RepID=UPI00378A1D65
MALVPWDVHLKTGQLAVFAAMVATALVTSVRRRPPGGGRTAGAAPEPPPPLPFRTPVVPTHTTPADPQHAAAVTDLCTCVAELASDLAQRYGGTY